MEMKRIIMRFLVGLLMIHIPFLVIAQEVNEETVKIEKDLISESVIRLKKVTNNSGSDVRINIKNSAGQWRLLTDIQKGKSHNCDIKCVSVRAEKLGQGATHGGGRITIWKESMTKDEWTNTHPVIQTSNTGKQEIEKTSKAKSKVEVKEDRKEYVDFSSTYYNAAQKIIVPSNNTEFDDCKEAADVEAILKTKHIALHIVTSEQGHLP